MVNLRTRAANAIAILLPFNPNVSVTLHAKLASENLVFCDVPDRKVSKKIVNQVLTHGVSLFQTSTGRSPRLDGGAQG